MLVNLCKMYGSDFNKRLLEKPSKTENTIWYFHSHHHKFNRKCKTEFLVKNKPWGEKVSPDFYLASMHRGKLRNMKKLTDLTKVLLQLWLDPPNQLMDFLWLKPQDQGIQKHGAQEKRNNKNMGG